MHAQRVLGTQRGGAHATGHALPQPSDADALKEAPSESGKRRKHHRLSLAALIDEQLCVLSPKAHSRELCLVETGRRAERDLKMPRLIAQARVVRHCSYGRTCYVRESGRLARADLVRQSGRGSPIAQYGEISRDLVLARQRMCGCALQQQPEQGTGSSSHRSRSTPSTDGKT